MKRAWVACVVALGLFGASAASALTITLAEYAVNVDGSVYDVIDKEGSGAVVTGTLPSGVTLGVFPSTGLGSVTVQVGGAGAHFVGLFADHEIDEVENTFFNEYGYTIDSAVAGQTWEIDEPGYSFGDIYSNFIAPALDDSNGVPETAADDVSMALGRAFTLAAGETAYVSFLLGTYEADQAGDFPTIPGQGLKLIQWDPDSEGGIYFSSSVRIDQGGGAIPEPGTMVLLGTGLLGLAGLRRRRTVG